MTIPLIGRGPAQVPLNQYLGDLAYMSQDELSAYLNVLYGPGAWVPVTLLNSFAEHSDKGWGSPPAYSKTGNRVDFRGLINGVNAAANATMFQLPAGYYPGYSQMFSVVVDDAFGQIRVLNDGRVVFNNSTAGTRNFISLHLSYRVA